MRVTVNSDEVRALGIELGAASREVTLESAKVIERAALNIKNGLIRDLAGSKHFPGLSRAISYDVRGLDAEIGPTLGGSGSLGGVVYEGTSNGPPSRDFMAPVNREIPLLEFHLADVATRAVFK